MFRTFLGVLVAMFVLFGPKPVFSAENDFPKEKIIAIATGAAKEKGIDIEAANIIYDEGGQLWSQTLGVAAYEDKSPNHGILKQGFLKNYRVVYFDFKEPLKDVWVFIDKDTGEVLTVYRE